MKISGNIVDVVNNSIYSGSLEIEKGKIKSITRDNKKYKKYIIPGFVDSHVHIESSMLAPAEFARIAAVHGNVGVVADPHEIANVLGVKGVKYMIDNAKNVPFYFYFSCPSCVPATPFETSGAALDLKDTEELLKMKEVKHLGEMMNFPGVLNNDKEVMAKLKLAKKYGKMLDGHCPALRGKDLIKYIDAGITTDHESFTLDEALEKIKNGMKIQIREGSAAKNFEALYLLIDTHTDNCMLCSDDEHPNDLVNGYINQMVKRAVAKGIDILKVLKVACVNPVKHYKLEIGLLQEGDNADFVVLDSLKKLNVLETYVKGQRVAKGGKPLIKSKDSKIVNNFKIKEKKSDDFKVKYKKQSKIMAIRALDGQLITEKFPIEPRVVNQNIEAYVEKDILKIAVVNRYENSKPAVSFINNFGLKKGAIASSVAHDSHNILVVGTNDEDICLAVNAIIANKGGIAVVKKSGKVKILPLPIAGIISDLDYKTVAKKYTKLDKMAKKLGSKLTAPFMTLSFMALLVIPSIKISDKGLFDGDKFKFM